MSIRQIFLEEEITTACSYFLSSFYSILFYPFLNNKQIKETRVCKMLFRSIFQWLVLQILSFNLFFFLWIIFLSNITSTIFQHLFFYDIRKLKQRTRIKRVSLTTTSTKTKCFCAITFTFYNFLQRPDARRHATIGGA